MLKGKITLCPSDETTYFPKRGKDEAPGRGEKGRRNRCLKSKNGICVIYVIVKNLSAEETECLWRRSKHRTRRVVESNPAEGGKGFGVQQRR